MGEIMEVAKAVKTLDRLLRFLAEEDYAGLCQFARGPNEAEMRQAAHDYPGRIVYPSVALDSIIDFVEVTDSNPKCWHVSVDLWTKEEGRSDLTLEAHFHENDGDHYRVEILGMHVL